MAATTDPAAGSVHRPPRRPRERSGAYSAMVGLMKLVLPSVALALIVLVIVWPRMFPDDQRFALETADVPVTDIERPTMLGARFHGTDDAGRPVIVTAASLAKDREQDRLVRLEAPQADMTLENGSWMTLTARDGTYQEDTKILDLSGDVRVFHDDGFEMHAETAHVNTDTRYTYSTDPVTGQGPLGTIEAAGIEVYDGGRLVIFPGPARMVMIEGAEAPQ